MSNFSYHLAKLPPIELKNALTGSLVGTAALFVICLNVSVLYVLVRGRFLVRRRNGIYILAFANMIGDTIQQLVTLLYAAPSSIYQSFLIDGDRNHPVVLLFAYLFLFAWYEGMLIQGLIALDRLVSVVFVGTARKFQLVHYVRAAVGIFVLAALMATWSQLVSPCCTAYVYYGSFGYAYLGETFNYSDHFVDLPLNTATSVVMFVCYAWIYLFVRRSNRLVTVTDDELARRKQKEIKFATQFSLVALVLAFTWIAFRVYPLIVPPGIPQLYAMITLALSFHCSTNASIFLTMNSEFRRTFAANFGFCGPKFGDKFVLSSVLNNNPTGTHDSSHHFESGAHKSH